MRSRRSSKGTGRYFDDSGSDTSSKQSGKSSGSRKKRIRVKDMRYTDENGKAGKYTGDVNEDHQPHGQGKMKYKDGSVFEGVWSDGSQAHGKTAKSSSSSKSASNVEAKGRSSERQSKSSSSDWARRDGKSNGADQPATAGSGGKKVVRKMKWMDYYGDPGEYSGEVDRSSMPNGKGVMKYDHGLIQEGLWEKGQFVEGSDVNVEEEVKKSKENPPKKSSSGAIVAGGNEKNSRRPSSSKTSTGKRDP